MQKGKHSSEHKSTKPWKAFFIVMTYILSSPFLLIWGMVEAFKYFRTLGRAIAPSVICRTCRNQIALVGMWQCECGFTYQGHLMRPCPICHRVPRVARCYQCNTTNLLD
jgi:hypothetical protein